MANPLPLELKWPQPAKPWIWGFCKHDQTKIFVTWPGSTDELEYFFKVISGLFDSSETIANWFEILQVLIQGPKPHLRIINRFFKWTTSSTMTGRRCYSREVQSGYVISALRFKPNSNNRLECIITLISFAIINYWSWFFITLETMKYA